MDVICLSFSQFGRGVRAKLSTFYRRGVTQYFPYDAHYSSPPLLIVNVKSFISKRLTSPIFSQLKLGTKAIYVMYSEKCRLFNLKL